MSQVLMRNGARQTAIAEGAAVKSMLLLGAALIAVMSPVQAYGQEQSSANDQTPERAGSGAQIEDIVVTAQKRSERVQDVPVAISAFNEATLARAGIVRITDLARVDPALNISSGSGVVVPFLRGVGNPSGTSVGNEASVPVYIDDVYYTRLASAYLELNNVERVEVLKGPQGTLFGRNASGGLMQVFTRDPGSTPALDASVGYANYNTVSGKFYGATPLGDRAAIDLAVTGLHQADGWGKTVASGQDVGKIEFVNARSKLIFDATETTRIRIIGFYAKMKTSQFINNTIFRGTTNATHPFYGPIVALPPPADFYDGAGTQTNFLRHEGWGGSIKIDQELGFADISSITAYRGAKEYYLAEGDMTPQNFLKYELNAIERQFSQELQVKSKPKSAFDWIIGGFYLYSKAGYKPTAATGDGVDAQTRVPGSQLDLVGVQTINSYSAYGQTTFHVIPEGTNITLGLRYTSDHVNGMGNQTIRIPGVGSFPAGPDYDKTFVFNRLTFKVAVDHHFGPDTLGYASFSRGYKSGIFNTLPLAADPSRPEVVDAYEAGLKTDLLDRRLRLNLAIFQNNIKNPQVQTIKVAPNGTAFIGFTNAESAKVRGAELTAEAVLADGFRFNLSGAYLDAKYTSFVDAPYLVQPTALPQNGGVCPGLVGGSPPVPAAEGGNCPIVSRDASGNRLAQVPRWRFSAGLSYDLNTSAGSFNFNANLAYTGQFFWQPDNILEEGPYALVNGAMTYKLPDNDHWSFTLWGKNLTGKKYYSNELAVAGSAGNIAAVAAPRTYGIEIRFQY